jgi:hypothetical protein
LADPRQQDQRRNQPVNGKTDHRQQAPAVYDPLLEYLFTEESRDELDEENYDADGVENEKPNAKSISHNPFHDDLTSRNVLQDLGPLGSWLHVSANTRQVLQIMVVRSVFLAFTFSTKYL